MNRNEAERKPHQVEQSPCAGCRKDRHCPAPCEAWKNWVRRVWPVVTGRERNHE